jgi:hypothetical protein
LVKKLVELVKKDEDKKHEYILNTHIRRTPRWGGIGTYEALIMKDLK